MTPKVKRAKDAADFSSISPIMQIESLAWMAAAQSSRLRAASSVQGIPKTFLASDAVSSNDTMVSGVPSTL
jgi:hypothetical protein